MLSFWTSSFTFVQMDNNSVKENILKLRKELGVTQKEMASRLGISRVAYANLESGDTRTISPLVEKAAEVGNVPVEALLLGKKVLEDGSGHAYRIREGYEQRISILTAEYGRQLSIKDKEIEVLKSLVDSLKENVNYQKEIISMLRKRIRENEEK